MVSAVELTFWEGTGAGWDFPISQGAKAAPTPPNLAFGTPILSASSLSSGKFGAVCTCTEKATGLKLATKVIKKQTPKDKVVQSGCVGRREPWSGCLSPHHPHVCTRGWGCEA